MKPIFSLILPVYNQADIIEPVFAQISESVKNMKIPFEIILVENGSTDGTEKITAKLARKYKNTHAIRTAKGYGSAVLAGLDHARGVYVCYMPSDGQVDLAALPLLFKLASTNRYQIVKIRRVNRESLLRMLVSKFFTLVLSVRFKTPDIDINGSPRILKTKDMKSLNLGYRDSFIDAEMLIKATRKKWSVMEIPMKNLPRYGGASSRSWKTFAEFMRNIVCFKV